MFGEFMVGPFVCRRLRRRNAHEVSFMRPALALIEQKGGEIVVLHRLNPRGASSAALCPVASDVKRHCHADDGQREQAGCDSPAKCHPCLLTPAFVLRSLELLGRTTPPER